MQTGDNWRDIATDPPPVSKLVLVQEENGNVTAARLKDPKYYKKPPRCPWQIYYHRDMPTPVLWQPFPEARKL